jgi:hypothetical protein
VIVFHYRDSNWPTPWEVEPALAWEPSWSRKFVKNTPTVSWTPSP